jgi:hypothetical protein
MLRRDVLWQICLLSPALCLHGNPANPPAVSDADQQAARKLLQDYADSSFDAGKRREVFLQSKSAPKAAQQALLQMVETEMAPALKAYQKKYQTGANAMLSNLQSKSVKDEIKRLQTAIQALGKQGGGLSKDAIVSTGDPARARLQELQKYDKASIVKRVAGLETERDRLISLIEGRELLREALKIQDKRGFPASKLKEDEERMAGTGPVMPRELKAIMDQNAKLASGVPEPEVEGVRLTNELRVLIGLPPVLLDPKLCEACRGHSKDMVEHKFFAHESPVSGKKTPWDRAKLAGTSAGAENIFAGSNKPSSAIEAWWHSPGHHVNMLNPGHKRMGMGVHGNHWTQMFG